MGPLKYLNFLTQTDKSRVVYLAQALAAVIVGSVVMLTLVAILFRDAPASQSGDEDAPPLFGLLVIWPIVSTLALWFILSMTRRATPTYWHAAGWSALSFTFVFALLAGLQTGLIFAWPYFIYSLTFLAWQLRSTRDGLFMTALLQAAVMAVPALIIKL
ncbi:hypothetical protein [Hyphomonas chukchiensis]|uniref:Yip1 domain-containing protein n=2 Tax=Hyphomonas chukchiensis TaxID=1280947 RepID=A0A062UMB3_9PROT|nr:hypothetical protein [Hyphomonas chukchiensis]KCZ57684.1 hypothetical protein HY30_05760 [Hyphomonas chukchiensis]